MNLKKDPTKIVVTTSSGKEVEETSQLKGEAKYSKVHTATNELKEYVTPSQPKGELGGEAH